jgi:thiamine kinase-like enzyme
LGEQLEDIVAGLTGSLGPVEAEPQPLSGGITNRNYLVRLGGGEYVIRRHGKDTSLLGIDRVAERLAGEAAARLGIAPEVVAAVPGGLVTRYVPCAELGPVELRARIDELASLLRGFHGCGVVLPAAFWVPDLLARYAQLLQDRGRPVPPEYGQALAVAGRIADALPEVPACPCHNDLLPGNLIAAERGGAILIVDWEYAGMGHPYFDLGNLSVNNGFDEVDDERLLAAYHDESPTDSRRATLKLMRVLSDAREAAWGVLQGVLSELDFDFAGYASRHFERLAEAAGAAEFEEWLAST